MPNLVTDFFQIFLVAILGNFTKIVITWPKFNIFPIFFAENEAYGSQLPFSYGS